MFKNILTIQKNAQSYLYFYILFSKVLEITKAVTLETVFLVSLKGAAFSLAHNCDQFNNYKLSHLEVPESFLREKENSEIIWSEYYCPI